MFFTKLALPFVLAAPFASALQVLTPVGWSSGDPAVLNWTAVNGDPNSFTVQLVQEAFHDTFGIANNVQTGAMSLSLTVPIVTPRDGYTIRFIDVGNVSNIFAMSAPFAIGATTSTTTALSTGSSSGSSSSSLSLSSPSSGASSSNSAGTTTAGNTGASSDSAPSTTPSTFNNGAMDLGFSRSALTGYAAMAAAAFAGARLVGF